ncbi:MAG: putative DNA-binding domain-containing protein [Labilithrix sp.]|nr:putative DNA-binding domain-containing protein [Labilithrix sp.]
MATLAEMQAVLAVALRRVSPIADDPELSVHAERIASGNDRLSPVEQVDIYREQFWLRHVDVLRDDFASIEYALGDDAFERLAHAYLEACPSASFTLRDLGEDMARFLATRAPWSTEPFLAELARVEWAFVDAFDGQNAPPFDPASIAGRSEDEWPGARIVLHPALQRLTLEWPTHDYRIGARKGEEPARPERRACHVVVYRGAELLHCLEIDADAAAMLDELARGTPLGEACERAAAKIGAAAPAGSADRAASSDETSGGGERETPLEVLQGKLAGWFSEWTSLGWIRSVRFDPEGP